MAAAQCKGIAACAYSLKNTLCGVCGSKSSLFLLFGEMVSHNFCPLAKISLISYFWINGPLYRCSGWSSVFFHWVWRVHFLSDSLQFVELSRENFLALSLSLFSLSNLVSPHFSLCSTKHRTSLFIRASYCLASFCSSSRQSSSAFTYENSGSYTSRIGDGDNRAQV